MAEPWKGWTSIWVAKLAKTLTLALVSEKSVPCEDLKPVLRELLIQQFGAQPKSTASQANGSVPAALAEPAVTETTAVPATIRFAQSNQAVACTQDDSILEVAEQAGVAIDSSCRSGNCGTCKQKLVSGKIRYGGEPDALDGDDRAQGYILTCIAHPIDQVAIEC